MYAGVGRQPPPRSCRMRASGRRSNEELSHRAAQPARRPSSDHSWPQPGADACCACLLYTSDAADDM
eukprot:1935101-Alexandrium_andersonii.AAC.1